MIDVEEFCMESLVHSSPRMSFEKVSGPKAFFQRHIWDPAARFVRPALDPVDDPAFLQEGLCMWVDTASGCSSPCIQHFHGEWDSPEVLTKMEVRCLVKWRSSGKAFPDIDPVQETAVCKEISQSSGQLQYLIEGVVQRQVSVQQAPRFFSMEIFEHH